MVITSGFCLRRKTFSAELMIARPEGFWSRSTSGFCVIQVIPAFSFR